jgi:ABC-type transport system involved in cytochrome c biogenesis permease subunit
MGVSVPLFTLSPLPLFLSEAPLWTSSFFQLPFSASLFFLFLATLHYLLYLVYRNPIVPRVARFTLYLTFAAQLGFFLSRYFLGGMPFGTNMYESLVFFSWCLVTAYLIITIKFKVPVVGAFVMPITLILMAAAALLPNKGIGEIPPALQSNWLPIHVTSKQLAAHPRDPEFHG